MWFRVDDGFIRHRKVSRAARVLGGPEHVGRVVAVWLEAGLWASANLSDGFVPDVEVAVFRTDIKGRADQVMRACVEAGLLDRVDDPLEPGYRFHDWDHYQPSSQEIKKKRAADRARKRPASAASPLGPHARLLESSAIHIGVDEESAWIPPRLLTESDAVPDGELRARARASAGDPDPVSVPPRSQAEKQRDARQPVRRALPMRLDFWQVQGHVRVKTYELLDDPAGTYLDATGRPDSIALFEAIAPFAKHALQADWQHHDEVMAVIDACIGQRASAHSASLRYEAFRRGKARQFRQLGRRVS